MLLTKTPCLSSSATAALEDLPEIFLGWDLDLVADLLRQRGIELQSWQVGVQDGGEQTVGVLDGLWRLFFGQAIDPALNSLLGQILELHTLDVPHAVFADLFVAQQGGRGEDAVL